MKYLIGKGCGAWIMHTETDQESIRFERMFSTPFTPDYTDDATMVHWYEHDKNAPVISFKEWLQ